MEPAEIKQLLRDILGDPEASIGPDVMSELDSERIELFTKLPDHEKIIATTAFLAAAGATQNAEERTGPPDNLEAFSSPILGERRTRAGMLAASVALERIPKEQRSGILNRLLDKCGCNPTAG